MEEKYTCLENWGVNKFALLYYSVFKFQKYDKDFKEYLPHYMVTNNDAQYIAKLLPNSSKCSHGLKFSSSTV